LPADAVVFFGGVDGFRRGMNRKLKVVRFGS
jgi:hypothetical protein